MAEQFDIVAIGGGTAGLVTAAGAAGLGARAALIEKDRLGGECLWTGCVPSKALIASARAAQVMRRAGDYGLPSVDPRPDGAEVLASVLKSRAAVAPHDDPDRFRAMGVDVVEGHARFVSPDEIDVEGRRIRGRKFVIATGSRPSVPPIDGLEETGYFTHVEAFDRASVPGSVIIIGGGAIGIELAQAYRRLGVEVTVVELLDRILATEDAEISDRLRAILEREGVRILTGRTARRTERVGEARVRVALDADGEPASVEAEEILIATGRTSNTDGLGLEAAGVRTNRGYVLVDERMRTSQRHIFAAGDVTGGLQFTHVADHEARTVVRNALFPGTTKVRYEAVPWCVFTDPELARVGLTEAEARERHGDAVRVHSYELSDLDRAITDRRPEGLVKLVADRKGRILGGHILGYQADMMISEVALALSHGIKLAPLSSFVHPYPTMAEGVGRAADAYMRAKLTDAATRRLAAYFRWARRLGI